MYALCCHIHAHSVHVMFHTFANTHIHTHTHTHTHNTQSGRLGHGNEEGCSVPKAIAALAGRRATQVSAGAYHSLVLKSDGTVLSFGYGFVRDR